MHGFLWNDDKTAYAEKTKVGFTSIDLVNLNRKSIVTTKM